MNDWAFSFRTSFRVSNLRKVSSVMPKNGTVFLLKGILVNNCWKISFHSAVVILVYHFGMQQNIDKFRCQFATLYT